MESHPDAGLVLEGGVSAYPTLAAELHDKPRLTYVTRAGISLSGDGRAEGQRSVKEH